MNKTYGLLAIAALFSLSACNNETKPPETGDMKKDSSAFSITEKPFGDFNSLPITQYTITNEAGMQVSLINYGGTLTDIITPDKDGNKGNVITGYESLAGYTQKGNPYFGALIGRFGNRIANGKFTLDSVDYKLAGNDHGNSLHGGLKGFDKVVWTAQKLPGDSSIELSYLSKDGEEGYPGNLTVKVVYSLSADNELKIAYTATTDKATVLNLTNHAYFNLSAGKDSTIFNHELMLKADSFTVVNDQLIPTGKLQAVKGGPMDFTTAKLIGKDFKQVKGGYDHNWALNRASRNSLEMVGTVYDSTSGREMTVFTTEPGIQFYTSNFLDGTLTNTKGNVKYIKNYALTLEAQHFPDAPNQPNFSTTVLRPGETYLQTTSYKFSVRK